MTRAGGGGGGGCIDFFKTINYLLSFVGKIIIKKGNLASFSLP